MTHLLLILGLLILMLLIFRFVQPGILYGLRRALLEVQTNRVFLDVLAERPVNPQAFALLLIRDSRFETKAASPAYVLSRIIKMRELYRLFDQRRANPIEIRQGQNPSACIVELGNIIEAIGRGLAPNVAYYHPIVPAEAVLREIANQILLAEGAPSELRVNNENDIQSWYSDNPMSIEQAAELLIAVAFALAYRNRAEHGPGARMSREPRVDVWRAIVDLERALRWSLRRAYRENRDLGGMGEQGIRQKLGERDYASCVKRMEQFREKSGGASGDFFDFVSLGQLARLLYDAWPVYGKVFDSRAWITGRLERIIAVRNDVAHSRAVSEADQLSVTAYCLEIDVRLRRSAETPPARAPEWESRA